MLSKKAFDAEWLHYMVIDEADSLITENADALYDICQTVNAKFKGATALLFSTSKNFLHKTQGVMVKW